MMPFAALCRRVAGIALLAAASLHAAEPNFIQVAELRPSGLKSGDQFGAAVAAGEGVIAVGAYLARGKAGTVYLFRRGAQGWETEPFQVLAGAGPGEWFGFDVALSRDGKLLAVGAPNPGKGTGAVYLYDVDVQRKTVTRRTVLSPSPGVVGDEFGSSVSIDGDWVAIGARGTAQRAGAVYVFPHSGEQPIPLNIAQPVAGAELGQSVSLRGGILAAGAPLPGKGGRSVGAVYRSDLKDGGWTPLQKFLDPDLEPGAAFGYSVAVQDHMIIAGAPLARLGGAVFRCVETRCKLESQRDPGDQLGVAVAADGSRTVIGARGADDGQGAAYLGSQELVPNSRKKGAEFGFSAAILGLTVVVGAFREGAAYIFEPSTLQEVKLSFGEAGEAREGTTVSVPVILDAPLSATTTVTVSAIPAIPGSAQPGSDYHLPDPIVIVVRESAETGEVGRVDIPILCDSVREGKETFDLKLFDSSGKVLDSLQIRIVNSPQYGLLVEPVTDPPLTTSESGSAATFSVRLACRPVSDVEITLMSLDPTEGSVAGDLRFTRETWGQSQLVQVTGQDDSLCDGDREYTVVIGTDTEDPQYKGISVPVLLTNRDNDACVSTAEEACVTPDDVVVYTVTVTNRGESRLEDGPGNELVIELPDEVRVATATADRGVVTVDHLSNAVAWNGSLPVGGEAVIEILAPLEPEADPAYSPCP